LAEKPKPATPKPSDAQAARAAQLRERIRGITSGARPGATPKTPRELTDEAARKKWEQAGKKKP